MQALILTCADTLKSFCRNMHRIAFAETKQSKKLTLLQSNAKQK